MILMSSKGNFATDAWDARDGSQKIKKYLPRICANFRGKSYCHRGKPFGLEPSATGQALRPRKNLLFSGGRTALSRSAMTDAIKAYPMNPMHLWLKGCGLNSFFFRRSF
jgi:hypothetical protein